MQGLVLINKPQGITSFSAVSKIKWLAGEKRVGHTGTLDPLATGLLPIFVGRATSLCSLMLDADKSYIATARLGITTDSADITGNVLSECKPQVSKQQLEEAITRFLGTTEQIPPMYSAIKKDGIRLYQLAREGKTVEIEPREIKISRIELLSFSGDTFRIAVDCSKGTYIRSLCRDIGEVLGCGATMTALCRTATGGFDLSQAVSLDELSKENFCTHLLSEERAISHLKEVFVTKKQAVRFSNGGQLSYERLKEAKFASGELLRIKCENTLIGVGIADNEKEQIAIKCLLNIWSE